MISLRLVLKLTLLFTLAVLIPSSMGFPQNQIQAQGRSLCAELEKRECTAITVCHWNKQKKDCSPVIAQFAEDGTGKDQNDDEDQEDEEQNDEKKPENPEKPEKPEEEQEQEDEEDEEDESQEDEDDRR